MEDKGEVVENPRHSRNVLDRLPSLPKLNPSTGGSDSADGPVGEDKDNVPVEDPYSVINKAASENTRDEVDSPKANDPTSDKGDAKEDAFDPPYTRIKRVAETDQNTDNTMTPAPVEQKPINPGNENEGVQKQDDTEALKMLDDIILLPEGSPVVDQKSKADPPYAKVIKRNKKNRGHVRVRFHEEGPVEIPTKPLTPESPASVNGVSGVDSDNVPKIEEGPDYI